MPDAAEPMVLGPKEDCCPRCLQTVPSRASRCPGCGQPIHSRRWLPLFIGLAGVFALVFAMLLMYRMVANEEDANAPPPVDEGAQQQQLFPDSPPAGSSSANEPSKPDKPPALDEH